MKKYLDFSIFINGFGSLFKLYFLLWIGVIFVHGGGDATVSNFCIYQEKFYIQVNVFADLYGACFYLSRLFGVHAMRINLIAICFVFLVGGVIWAYASDFFNPRPSTLATSILNHQAVPVVREAEINGFRIAHLRTSDLNESGPIPYQSKWNNDLHFEVIWIEFYNEQAWHAEFTIPIERLPTIRGGRSAGVNISIGLGGDLLVWARQQEFLRLVELQRDLSASDELRLPDVIYELCADRLADDDPRRQALFVGFEDWAINGMTVRHNQWMRDNSLPTSRCSPDWSLRYE